MMFLPLSFLLKCFCYGLVRLANVFLFFLLLWGILLNFIKNKKIFWVHGMTICLFTECPKALIVVKKLQQEVGLFY